MYIPTRYNNYLNTMAIVCQKLATLQFWKSGSKSPASPEMGKEIDGHANKQGYCTFCKNTMLVNLNLRLSWAAGVGGGG